MTRWGWTLLLTRNWISRVTGIRSRYIWTQTGCRLGLLEIKDRDSLWLRAVCLSSFLAICVAGCNPESRGTLNSRSNGFYLCIMQLTSDAILPDHVVRDKNGVPTCSWRFACDFAVTCRGGANPETVNVKLPWTDPTLAHWRKQRPKKYCFLTDADTNVMAVIGDGTAFPPDSRLRASDLPNDLILIIEVQNTGIHWMAPGDLDVVQVAKALSRKNDNQGVRLGTTSDGFLVGFVDGEVWMLSYRTPLDRLLTFCSIESAQRYDRDKLLLPFRVANP